MGQSRLLTSIICILLLTSSALAADSKKLVVTGASTIAPLVMEIAKRFENENPGVRIDVQSGGSSKGVADARDGTADIGMVSRELKDEEKDLKSVTIARDGVTIILNSANPVKSLSNDQILSIYTGKIRNWKEVGGKDASITVVNKAEGRSTLELFLNFFKLKNSDVKAQIVIGDNIQGIKTVASSVNAIGYVSIGSAEAEAKAGAKLKLLPINGIQATVETVRNGSFPLSRPLNLVTKEVPTSLKKDFIEYAKSKKVADLVQGLYFVPIVQ